MNLFKNKYHYFHCILSAQEWQWQKGGKLVPYVKVIIIKSTLIMKRKRNSRKKVSAPAPKYPSISFIESFHNLRFRMKLWMYSCDFVLHNATNWRPRFHRFVPIRWLFSFTILSTLDFIWRLICNDCGRARSILLK